MKLGSSVPASHPALDARGAEGPAWTVQPFISLCRSKMGSYCNRINRQLCSKPSTLLSWLAAASSTPCPSPVRCLALTPLLSPSFPDLSFPLAGSAHGQDSDRLDLTEALNSRDISSVDHNSCRTGTTETTTSAWSYMGRSNILAPGQSKLVSSPQVLTSPL